MTKPRKTRKTRIDRERVRKLHAEGMPLPDIAEAVGGSQRRVREIHAELGIAPIRRPQQAKRPAPSGDRPRVDVSWHETYLDALRGGRSMLQARQVAGRSELTVARHRKQFPEFNEAVEKARQDGRVASIPPPTKPMRKS